MARDKSPRPDSFRISFFKDYWDTVGNDVITAVLHFFHSGQLPGFVNSLFLALIPKKMNASEMKDFRPISCCNVIYKLISKVIANRMKRVLPSLINRSQSTFVQGRLISDNIMLAHEILRPYGSKNISPRVALKVDLMKAFDSVN
ncbi:Transposon TX1 uncharacterized 149 kDa protein [Linum perenne]